MFSSCGPTPPQAGLIEEMIDDQFSSMEEDGLEEEADEEVRVNPCS